MSGFGSFIVKRRNAREGLNPKTGEAVSVAAKRVPFFKAGKELKQRVDRKPADVPAGSAAPERSSPVAGSSESSIGPNGGSVAVARAFPAGEET